MSLSKGLISAFNRQSPVLFVHATQRSWGALEILRNPEKTTHRYIITIVYVYIYITKYVYCIYNYVVLFT